MKKLVLTLTAIFLLSFSVAHAQSSTPVFQDSFESGDASHTENGFQWGWMDSDYGESGYGVRTDNPRTGTYSFALDVPPEEVEDGVDQEMNLVFPSTGFKEVWAEYYLWIPSNYNHSEDSPDNNKWIQFFDTRSDTQLGIIPETRSARDHDGSSGIRFVPYDNTDVDTSHDCCGWKQGGDVDGLGNAAHTVQIVEPSDFGTWVRYRYHVKASDYVDPGQEDQFNGVFEMWKNDELITGWYDLGIRNADETITMQRMRILGHANSGFQNEMTLYIDDVKIYTEDPGWSSNATSENTTDTDDTAGTDVDGDGANASVDCDDNDATVQNTISCDYDGSSCGTYDLCVSSCPVPPSESCDGVDNDCDGQVDEGCDVNQSQEGLILHYDFEDGTATDVSGANNHGTLLGANSQQGRYGQGIFLDGVDDYVNTSFRPTLDDFTLSAWINPDSLVSEDGRSQRIISAQSATTTDNLFLLRLEEGSGCSQGAVSFTLEEGNGGIDSVCSNETLSTSSWYHLAGVREGSELRVYINGVLSGTVQNVDTDPITPDAPLEIGRLEGGREYFGGVVDEVKVYDRSLSAEEVEALSSNTLGDNATPSFVQEDVNQDGSVNIFDLVQVARNVGSSDTSYDMNGDGSVNVFDLVSVVQVIVGSASGGVDSDGDGVNSTVDCDDSDASVQDTMTCNYDGNSCGSYELCTTSCPIPPSEVCGDSSDNDCDGQVDEGCDLDTNTSLAHPNEPEDHTTSYESHFNTETRGEGDPPEDWGSFADDPNYTQIVEDPTAPTSPPNVGRITYPEGFGDGSSPGGWGGGPTGQHSSIYGHFWMKTSPNWQHQTIGNKIFYITDDSYHGGGDPAYLHFSDNHFHVRIQGGRGSQNGGWNLGANLGSFSFNKGEWYEVEVVLTMNTGDNYDGEAHVWINGEKTHEYTDINYEHSEVDSDADRQWDAFTWNPYWGGSEGDVVQEEMYAYMDHLYVSGN